MPDRHLPGRHPPEHDLPPGASTDPSDIPTVRWSWRDGGSDDPPVPLRRLGAPCPATRSAAVHLAEAIGLHLICPLRVCRRARRCAEPDEGLLPLCIWQHRGTFRFALAIAAERHGLKHGPAQDPKPAFPRRPPPADRDTMIGRFAAAGAPVHELARAPDDYVDEWTWEHSETAWAIVHPDRPDPAREGREG